LARITAHSVSGARVKPSRRRCSRWEPLPCRASPCRAMPHPAKPRRTGPATIREDGREGRPSVPPSVALAWPRPSMPCRARPYLARPDLVRWDLHLADAQRVSRNRLQSVRAWASSRPCRQIGQRRSLSLQRLAGSTRQGRTEIGQRRSNAGRSAVCA
jgi:hypothetical protein